MKKAASFREKESGRERCVMCWSDSHLLGVSTDVKEYINRHPFFAAQGSAQCWRKDCAFASDDIAHIGLVQVVFPGERSRIHQFIFKEPSLDIRPRFDGLYPLGAYWHRALHFKATIERYHGIKLVPT
jgi:hypothetical protein